MKQCVGTFLATGMGLSRLINSEYGRWHETYPHHPAFSQAIPEHGLGAGGSEGPLPIGSVHAVTQLPGERTRYHRCGLFCGPADFSAHLIY